MKFRSCNYLFVLVLWFFSACSCSSFTNPEKKPKNPVEYVNPYMGNISHMLVPTYPTIHLPNSMLRVYPERSDFSGVRLNGLPLMTTSRHGSSAFILSPFQGDEKKLLPVISSCYDHENLTPYSYSVYLDELQVQVNYGLSNQSAIYDIEFVNKMQPMFLILNSKEGELRWDGMTLSGYQLLQNDTKVFLFLAPDILPQSVRALENSKLVGKLEANGHDASLVLKYPVGTPSLKLSYGVSFISIEQARKNMERELDGQNIDQLHDEGRRIWNDVLGQIEVTGGTDDEKTVFYTSLYRYYQRPVCISEDGRYYNAFDGKIHDDGGVPFFTDDWIWDTYRVSDPLRVLLKPELQTSIIKSYLRMAEQMDSFREPLFPEVTVDSLHIPVVANLDSMFNKAFVVFSQLGFYPGTPGLPIYNIGSPTFQTAKIKLPNGEVFEVVAENYSPKNIYIQSAKLNGEIWTKPWFSHSDIVNGGELVLEMGKYPNKQWGAEQDAAPPSFSMDNKKNL